MKLEAQFPGRSSRILTWLEDEKVTDVLMNGIESFYIEKGGKLVAEEHPFKRQEEVMEFLDRILIPAGKQRSALSPCIDGSLMDGSRFHLVLPPTAPHGPIISIRKFGAPSRVCLADFGDKGVIQFLKLQVCKRKNILVVGGTGSGKTTLLSRLLDEVSPEERIAVLEETLEIRSRHPHLVRLQTRKASPEGTGEVTLRVLVQNALRMRPDRILVGECRGEEAFDMIQAMNTGHSGSVCTLHSSGALDGLSRLEGLCLLSGRVDLAGIRKWIGANIDLVVFLERAGEGRKITEIIKVRGLEGTNYRIFPVLDSGGFRAT